MNTAFKKWRNPQHPFQPLRFCEMMKENLRLTIVQYQLFFTAIWQKHRLIRLIPHLTPIPNNTYKEDSSLIPQLHGLLCGALSPLSLDIPYEAKGTPFCTEVWATLLTIPYGQTISYKNLAKMLNTSPRAIGQALKANPLPIIIPCHRVIKTNGKLGGFSCGIELKQILLNIENLSKEAI